MPRPTRIEYSGAFHHVMNRGRHRRTIFHDDMEYHMFLQTLQEAHLEYGAIFHAYCLMGNHYHLLIETPKANLGLIMKHVNGLYTQRYNRKRKLDGPLFRGRYKSVLVDSDDYLLQLSRYIHRNPIDTKRPLISSLKDYLWSSYPAYINQVSAPDWLNQEKTYQMLGHRHRFTGYRNYVEEGVDEDIKRFYSKGNVLSVLGSKEFRKEREEENKHIDTDKLRLALEDKPEIEKVMKLVSQALKMNQEELRAKSTGRRVNKAERAFAIYACHQYSQASHKDIAVHFNLSHVGSVSHPLSRIRKEIQKGAWGKEIKWVEKQLYIVKRA